MEEAEFAWDSDTSAGTGEKDVRPCHSVPHYRVTEDGATIPGKVLLTFLEDGSSMEVHPEQVHKAVHLLDPSERTTHYHVREELPVRQELLHKVHTSSRAPHPGTVAE